MKKRCAEVKGAVSRTRLTSLEMEHIDICERDSVYCLFIYLFEKGPH